MAFPERNNKTVPLGSGRVYVSVLTGETIPSEAELVALCTPENLIGESKGGSTITYNVTVHQESDDHGVLTRDVLTEEDAKLKCGFFSWGLDGMQKLVRTGRVVKSKDGRFKTLKIGGLDNDNGEQYVVVFQHTDKKYSPLYAAMVGTNGAGLTIPFARDNVSKLEPEFTGIPCDNEGTRILIFEDLGEQASVASTDEQKQAAESGDDPGTETE